MRNLYIYNACIYIYSIWIVNYRFLRILLWEKSSISPADLECEFLTRSLQISAELSIIRLVRLEEGFHGNVRLWCQWVGLRIFSESEKIHQNVLLNYQLLDILTAIIIYDFHWNIIVGSIFSVFHYIVNITPFICFVFLNKFSMLIFLAEFIVKPSSTGMSSEALWDKLKSKKVEKKLGPLSNHSSLAIL